MVVVVVVATVVAARTAMVLVRRRFVDVIYFGLLTCRYCVRSLVVPLLSHIVLLITCTDTQLCSAPGLAALPNCVSSSRSSRSKRTRNVADSLVCRDTSRSGGDPLIVIKSTARWSGRRDFKYRSEQYQSPKTFLSPSHCSLSHCNIVSVDHPYLLPSPSYITGAKVGDMVSSEAVQALCNRQSSLDPYGLSISTRQWRVNSPRVRDYRRLCGDA